MTAPSAACEQSHLATLLARNLDAAFEQLVSLYQDRIYAFAYRLTGNPQDAEEVAQDTFVRGYTALQRYPSERIEALQVRPWLYQIAVNVVRNRVRGKHLPQVSLETDAAGATWLEDAEEGRPESATLAVEGQRELGALVAELPRRLRIAVVLRHVEGFAYREIADLLDLPLGTVKSDVHRGTLLLRRALVAQPSEVR